MAERPSASAPAGSSSPAPSPPQVPSQTLVEDEPLPEVISPVSLPR